MCNLCKMFRIQQNRIQNGFCNAYVGCTGPTARSPLWWWCILRSIRTIGKSRQVMKHLRLTYNRKVNQLDAGVPLNLEHIGPDLLVLIPVGSIPFQCYIQPKKLKYLWRSISWHHNRITVRSLHLGGRRINGRIGIVLISSNAPALIYSQNQRSSVLIRTLVQALDHDQECNRVSSRLLVVVDESKYYCNFSHN